jgi:hypothetical protein
MSCRKYSVNIYETMENGYACKLFQNNYSEMFIGLTTNKNMHKRTDQTAVVRTNAQYNTPETKTIQNHAHTNARESLWYGPSLV